MLWNKINKISKKILKIMGIVLLMALAVSIGMHSKRTTNQIRYINPYWQNCGNGH